jgi:hypothetical protein
MTIMATLKKIELPVKVDQLSSVFKKFVANDLISEVFFVF